MGPRMSGPPIAVAEGTLAQTPFGHLLVYVLGKRLTGTLALWPDADATGTRRPGQDRVRFETGFAVSAKLLDPAPALDRGLLALFTRTSAPYAFYETDLVGSGPDVIEGRVDPYALVAASLRGTVREELIDAVLSSYGDRNLRIRQSAELQRFDLLPKERAFVELIRAAPATVQQLVATSGDARIAKRTLYLLTLTKLLDVLDADTALTPRETPIHAFPPPPSDEFVTPRILTFPPATTPSAKPPLEASLRPPLEASLRPPRNTGKTVRASIMVAEPEPAPPPPPELPGPLWKRWTSIGERCREIEEQDFFQMLGLKREAKEEEIRDAYFKQAKDWHPDRLPPELAPLRPWSDRIFHHLTEAKDTLTTKERRDEYMRGLRAGGGTPASVRKIGAVVQAAMEFEKVEVLVRRRDWESALDLIENAIRMDAEDANYHAIKGWILFNKHSGSADAPFGEIMESVNRALQLQPQCERAFFYKGMILKHQGMEDHAIRFFSKAAKLNPKNLDAVREVRLAGMRGKIVRSTIPPAGADETETKSGASGLLARFLKKKK